MSNILLITTMYPGPLRPGTAICHYFAKEWGKMGHHVLVVHYRSMFPRLYTDIAGLFPKLALRYVGDHVEMDRNMDIIEYEEDGIRVYSIPIFKYIPHGRYPQRVINRKVKELQSLLQDEVFVPDAIIGHFHNPQFEIVSALKEVYPLSHTCVSLHEPASVIEKCYGSDSLKVINGVDMIGFRSVVIKEQFEERFGNKHNSFVCWSGTPQFYIDTPSTFEREFNDGPITKFLYVGQTIERKHPLETVKALYNVYGSKEFYLTFVGTKDLAYPSIERFINEKQLGRYVSFVGKIPRDEIIKQYDQNECFILISRGEVFGLVYLEAMSRGCITIASRNEGMEGIIEHGINGFLCEAGSSMELSGIIKQINELSGNEKKMISEAAIRTARKLSDFNVAKAYLDAVMGV